VEHKVDISDDISALFASCFEGIEDEGISVHCFISLLHEQNYSILVEASISCESFHLYVRELLEDWDDSIVRECGVCISTTFQTLKDQFWKQKGGK
jgi:hypothetical protein